MNSLRNVLQTVWTVPYAVHARNVCKEDLRSADVRCRLLATDVLLSCL